MYTNSCLRDEIKGAFVDTKSEESVLGHINGHESILYRKFVTDTEAEKNLQINEIVTQFINPHFILTLNQHQCQKQGMPTIYEQIIERYDGDLCGCDSDNDCNPYSI